MCLVRYFSSDFLMNNNIEASYINLICWLSEELIMLDIKDKDKRKALVLTARKLPINERSNNII